MASGSQQNELYGLQTENRHLREMIGALRDEMEKMQIGERERLQKALSSDNDEIGQLRNMVVALRDELDRRKIEAEEKSRAMEKTAHDEAKQLHEMIRTLRERLEDHEKRDS